MTSSTATFDIRQYAGRHYHKSRDIAYSPDTIEHRHTSRAINVVLRFMQTSKRYKIVMTNLALKVDRRQFDGKRHRAGEYVESFVNSISASFPTIYINRRMTGHHAAHSRRLWRRKGQHDHIILNKLVRYTHDLPICWIPAPYLFVLCFWLQSWPILSFCSKMNIATCVWPFQVLKPIYQLERLRQTHPKKNQRYHQCVFQIFHLIIHEMSHLFVTKIGNGKIRTPELNGPRDSWYPNESGHWVSRQLFGGVIHGWNPGGTRYRDRVRVFPGLTIDSWLTNW